MRGVSDAVRTAVRRSAEVWPGIPFLAFGAWQGWSILSYGCSAWLSDTDPTGMYLSLMFVVSTSIFALTCLVLCLCARLRGREFTDRRFALLGGSLASTGSLMILLVGPYYLGSLLETDGILFLCGAALTGFGTALTMLRIGWCYTQLSFRRALVYIAFSEIVIVLVHFFIIASPGFMPISGGPTLTGMLLFSFLPLAAAVIACWPSVYLNESNQASSDSRESGTVKSPPERGVRLFRFLVLVLSLSITSALLRSSVLSFVATDLTLAEENFYTLCRIPICVLLLGMAVFSKDINLGIGRNFTIGMAVIVAVMAALSISSDAQPAAQLVVNVVYMLFVALFWCLLADYCQQRAFTATTVFGAGYAALMGGSAAGWAYGLYVSPLISDEISQWVYLACGLLVFVCGFVILTKGSFASLITASSTDALTAEEKGARGRRSDEAAPAMRKGWFRTMIDRTASEHMLTAREAEVFFFLGMGHGAEYIAHKLTLSVSTVRTHTHNIYLKLGIHSRSELMEFVTNEKQRTRRENVEGGYEEC